MMESKEIFVFGSNLAGHHGAGAAKYAIDNHGAIYGCGVGFQGNSYAIPTKDENIMTMTLDIIEMYVKEFLQTANNNPEITFMVTAIGTGLAGISPEYIAPMFSNSPSNVKLPKMFLEIIRPNFQEHEVSFGF